MEKPAKEPAVSQNAKSIRWWLSFPPGNTSLDRYCMRLGDKRTKKPERH